MPIKKRTKYLLVAFVFLSLISGLVIMWKTYGPGWKKLTVKSIEWERKELEDGRTIEFSTTFFISDTADLRNYYFVCNGSQVLQLLINHKIIMDKNPFSYYSQNLDSSSFQVFKYYDSQAHFMGDDVVKSAIRPGYNSLRVWTTEDGLRKLGNGGWKFGAQSTGFSTRYRNDTERTGYAWKPNSEIPVLYIDIPDHLIPDDPKVRGKSRMLRGNELIFSSDVLMETRGRSSQAFDKKQFNLRTVETGSKSPMAVQVAHMASSSEWVIYGPFIDLSQIRNDIAYSLSQDLGHYAPKSIPVELVLNNNYRGLYFFMEKIRSQPGRVDIRFDPSDSLNESNNAFLVQANQPSAKDVVLYPSKLAFILEDPTDGFKAEKWYIKRATEQLAIITRAIDDQIPNLDQAIDFKSFADFYIVNELAKNIDAYRLSTYFHKTHEDDNPRMFAGPIWDFNLAFGNTAEGGGTKTDGWIFDNPGVVDSIWVKLFNHPTFHQFLQQRYSDLRKGLISEVSINQRIDSLVNNISPVLANNWARYGWPSTDFWPYEKVPADYSTEIANIKGFIASRLKWMDGELRD
jgi:CotH kinase protein